MKVAYFSPLPPKKTGIATYSLNLVPELAKRVDLHVFDAGIETPPPFQGIPAFDFLADPERLIGLDDYGALLYHIGNNPRYHLDIYKVLLRRPGVVVLHDTVLYFLAAGLGRGGWIKEFCRNYGLDRLDEVWDLLDRHRCSDIVCYESPERFPFLRRTLSAATAVIVHSRTSADIVRSAGFEGKVHVVEHLIYPDQMRRCLEGWDPRKLRKKHGIDEDELLIGCFGFIVRTKRIPSVLKALACLEDRVKFKLLVVGEGEDMREEISRNGLEGETIRTGFVDDEAFNRYLALTDIVVNLRYPSMGETSGTLVQSMAYGKPCIVTDHAWFSELPDECVRKIGYGKEEVEQLVQGLGELAFDPDLRNRMGRRAKEYVEISCTPARIARRYHEVLEQTVRETDWVRSYLLERMAAVLPGSGQG